MSMKNSIVALFAMLLSVSVSATENDEISVVPLPASVDVGEGAFYMDCGTALIVRTQSERYENSVIRFAEELRDATDQTFRVTDRGKSKHNISFNVDTALAAEIGYEGYILSVTRDHVDVSAVSEAGWFYAQRTLLQLIRQKQTKKGVSYYLPSVEIKDYPQYSWRGLMLDVSRHFFSVEDLKSYIDQMANYKLNTFHLHLTDNQGWRIEIESLPELVKVGAWRVPRTGYWTGFKPPQPGEKATYGGYYSHDQIKELVKYAKDRNVTIVPEIDVPGHSLALIASYPELSCTKTPQQVLAGDKWNISRTNVLCVSNDSVYDALDKVITELCTLFLSEYIHIGGDEVNHIYWKNCPSCRNLMERLDMKDEKELQGYFIRRLSDIVKSKGKKVMGWYENLPGGLVDSMTYMSWKDYKGGVVASQQGHKVVMTPAFFTYLDFYQGDPAMENGPFTVCRLSSCYAFDPEQDGADRSNILGGQGSLWTEQVPNVRKLQYMTWPRGMALAEVLWTPKGKREWNDFVTRMEAQFPRFETAGINYSRAFYEPILKVEEKDDELYIVIDTEVSGLKVYYTFDDCSPDNYYPEYVGKKVKIPEGAHHVRAVSYKDGKPVGRELNISLAELKSRMRK